MSRNHVRTTDGARQFCCGCLKTVTTYDTVFYETERGDYANRRFHFCTDRLCQQKAAASKLGVLT